MRLPVCIVPRNPACDALAVLAHLYLRFDRPAEAAALLAALPAMGADAAWVGRSRCVALLAAGQFEAAETLAKELLPRDPGPALLQVLARACWRTGRPDAARAYAAEAREAAAIDLSGTRRRVA